MDSCSKDARKAEAVKPNEVASPASSFPCVVLAHAALFDGSFEQTRRTDSCRDHREKLDRINGINRMWILAQKINGSPKL